MYKITLSVNYEELADRVMSALDGQTFTELDSYEHIQGVRKRVLINELKKCMRDSFLDVV